MSIFDDIAGARASVGGNYFKDGKGRLVIAKMFIDRKEAGQTFIAETRVLRSQATTPDPANPSQLILPNQPETEVSYVQLLDKHKSAKGNVKAFVLALLGYEESEVSNAEFAATLQDLCSDANPARGMVIDYETYRKNSKEKKIEMILPRWSKMSQEPTEIERMKKWLDQVEKGEADAA